MFRQYLLPLLVFWFYRLLSVTWRVKVIEPEELKDSIKKKKANIFAIWHGDELVMISLTSRYHLCTLTSQSKDGELMDFVLQKMGMKTARGSSSRGAISGLKKLIRLAREGRTTVFAVDGPRGPYHKIKPGVFDMAKRLKTDVYAAGVAVQSKFVFKKAWNKAYLPLPFSRVVIVWSKPLSWEKMEDPRDEALEKELEEKFNAAGRLAGQYLAGHRSE